MRSENCASNPRLDNSPITRSSPAGTRDFRFLLNFSACGLAHRSTRQTRMRSDVHRTRCQAFESRRTIVSQALSRQAPPRGFSPVRRPWRRSWRPWRRSLRWVRRPCRRCVPWVPVAAAGAAGVAASCASASNGSSAEDSVKPSAAPSPSRESAFRREIVSMPISCFISSLPVTHPRWAADLPSLSHATARALRMARKQRSQATKTAAERNLVELRGHALKNYEVARVGKSSHAATMPISDRRDPILDREVNKLSAAVKSVHFHDLVLVEFNSSRGNRKIARNLLRRTPLREQLQNLPLAWREQLRAFATRLERRSRLPLPPVSSMKG